MVWYSYRKILGKVLILSPLICPGLLRAFHFSPDAGSDNAFSYYQVTIGLRTLPNIELRLSLPILKIIDRTLLSRSIVILLLLMIGSSFLINVLLQLRSPRILDLLFRLSQQ